MAKFPWKIALIIFIFIIGLNLFTILFINQQSLFSERSEYHPKLADCQAWTNLSYIDIDKYQQCLQWHRDDNFWDKMDIRHTIHKDYINSSSLILEVGGNIGEDSSQFVKLYNCSIIIFEPLVPMYKNLVKKFENNSQIQVRSYGLGDRARNVSVELRDANNEGTSIFRQIKKEKLSNIEQMEILSVVDIIEDIRKTQTKDGMIDLITINCEGCEFEVLPALIKNNLIQYFRNIQFGTHGEFLSDALCIYCHIEQSLERTHQPTYHYRLLWESWTLKNRMIVQ